jgi:ADP-ribosyl-[dinitrogen reductase] hydrolase
MSRTSLTHPLQIGEVRVAERAGRVGITFCPGKKQDNGMTGPWERDLELDVAAIVEWGAHRVVTLVEPQELVALQVPGLGDAVARHGMQWSHLPIRDRDVPSESFEASWGSAGEQIRSELTSGLDVVVHCMGGLGRAGTIAARLLVELGWSAQQAIARVREVRPKAIETVAQEEHVRAVERLRRS